MKQRHFLDLPPGKRKMQNIEASVIKGSAILTKVVNKLAVFEKDSDDALKSNIVRE